MKIPKIRICPYCGSSDLKRKKFRKYKCNGCGAKIIVKIENGFIVITAENETDGYGIRTDEFKKLRREGVV